jgi:hypothetical protein
LKEGIMVCGIGGVSKGTLNQGVQVKLSSLLTNTPPVAVDALIIDQVTSKVPRRQVKSLDWPQLESLRLADEYFHTPGPVDMLLGADVYPKLILSGMGVLKKPDKELLASSEIYFWLDY